VGHTEGGGQYIRVVFAMKRKKQVAHVCGTKWLAASQEISVAGRSGLVSFDIRTGDEACDRASQLNAVSLTCFLDSSKCRAGHCATPR